MGNIPALWEQLTLEGSLQFENGLCHQAVATYDQARMLVMTCFDQWPDPLDAVAALVVSYLNLSEAQAHAGAVQAACASACMIHQGMARASCNPQLAWPIRCAARCHLADTCAAVRRLKAHAEAQGQAAPVVAAFMPDGTNRTLH